MSKRAILHIPHSEMLITRPLKYWVSKFEHITRTSPTEVVLPGVGYLGPTFRSDVFDLYKNLTERNSLPVWIRQVHDEMGSDVKIWTSIIPAYPFLQLETLMIQDQYGVRFDSQVCITNTTIQKITDVLIEEILNLDIDGIVFDLTDIYPNSSSNAVRGIQNSCFCTYCINELNSAGWSAGTHPFLGDDNITRFILKVTDSGTDHIEASSNWIREVDATALLDISKARGFVSKDDNDLDSAELCLRYLSARGRVTAKAVSRITQVPNKYSKRVAIVLNDQYFDMTQCTDLRFLADLSPTLDYWVPAVDPEFALTTGLSVAQFLFGRGGYGLNAFFELIATADETLSAGNTESFIRRLANMSRHTRSNKMSRGSVFAVELADEYSGFVGIPIDQDDVVRFIEGLATGKLGQVVPAQVIDQLVDHVR